MFHKGRTGVTFFSLVLTLTVCIAAPATAQHNTNREEPGAGPNPRVSTGPIAPRLEGLGNHEFPVTTSSEEAQAFINQGAEGRSDSERAGSH